MFMKGFQVEEKRKLIENSKRNKVWTREERLQLAAQRKEDWRKWREREEALTVGEEEEDEDKEEEEQPATMKPDTGGGVRNWSTIQTHPSPCRQGLIGPEKVSGRNHF